MSLLGAVHPDAAVRDAAEGHELEARRFASDLHLDVEVHDRAGRPRPRASRRSGPAGAGRRAALVPTCRGRPGRGHPRAGAGAGPSRAGAGPGVLARASATAGGRPACRRSRSQGCPQDYLDEHPAGEDGLVEVSTDYPDTLPFLTHARDPDVRRRVTQAMHDVAWPDNEPVLAELLTTRRERATLLGYTDWASYDAEVKMIADRQPDPGVRRPGRRRRRGAGPPRPRGPAGARPGGGRGRPSTPRAGGTTSRRCAGSGSTSTPRRYAATSTPARSGPGCSR